MLQQSTILTLIFCAFFLDSQSQNGAPYWSLSGNNNISSSSKLGTTNLTPLHLTTNNATHLYIGTDGKIGVGTTAPLTLLHVKGFGAFGNQITSTNATRILNLADNKAVLRILRVDASDAPAVELISRTSADGNNVAYWDMYAQPSDASFRIRDRRIGGLLDRFTITSGGNVGIGTTSPGTRLQAVATYDGDGISVAGSALGPKDAAFNLTDDAGNGGSLGLASANNAFILGVSKGDMVLTSRSGKLHFATGAATEFPTMTVAKGSVGIGTLSPAFALDVSGRMRLQSNGNTAGIWLNNTTNSGLNGFMGTYNDNHIGWYGKHGWSLLMNTDNGYVGIGTTTPSAPLEVNNATPDFVIKAVNENINVSEWGAILGSTPNRAGFGIGVYGVGGAFGVEGKTSQADNDFSEGASGVFGFASAVSRVGNRTGVSGLAIGGEVAIGVGGAAYSGAKFSAAGYFNGDVYATDYMTISDRKFKRDITPLENSLSQLMKLKPSTYQFKDDYKQMALPKGMQMGLIADEVKEVFPELVHKAIQPPTYDQKDSHKQINPAVEYEAVNYQGLIPVLVASVQQQQSQIDDLKKTNIELQKKVNRTDSLETRIARLEALLINPNNTSVVLPTFALLETPIPNPNSGSALINYRIPASANTVELVIADAKGSYVKQMTLSSRGNGQLRINTASLRAGTYICTLYVDGTKANSKTMEVLR